MPDVKSSFPKGLGEEKKDKGGALPLKESDAIVRRLRKAKMKGSIGG